MAYLYDNPNPNAPRRANGIRFWGYPTRSRAVQLIGIHTAENLPDFTPPDRGAENVANYLATTNRAASYHLLVDSDSHVELLPDEATAFGARGYNSHVWHMSFATQAHRWNTAGKPGWWTDAVLQIGAREAAKRARKFGIPFTRITKAQADAGQKGFIDHARLDSARRTDPGRDFPWDKFLGLARDHLRLEPVKPDWEVAIITNNDVDAGMAELLGVKYLWKRLPHTTTDTIGWPILIGSEGRNEAAWRARSVHQQVTVLRGATRRETAMLVLGKIDQDKREP